MATNQNMPPPPLNTPLEDPATGLVSTTWAAFFRTLFIRIGGFVALTNIQLASLTGTVRSGNQSIPNGNSSVAVTFSAPYADTTYSVSAHMINVIDTSPMFQPVVITQKLTTGFTASFNAPVDSANYVICWMALKGT